MMTHLTFEEVCGIIRLQVTFGVRSNSPCVSQGNWNLEGESSNLSDIT